MKKKHLILLKKLIKKKKERFDFDSPYDILIHSVLNNIELKLLIKYYISMEESEIKNSINSNINKRLVLTKNPKNIYSKLYNELESANYVSRQRIRNILFTLLPQLPNLYYEDYFNTFYYSKYSNDKKSAISIYEKVSNPKHHEIILKDYFEYNNEIYLRALINDKAVKILSLNIEEIWLAEPRSYLKRMLIFLLHQNHLSVLNFLKIKDTSHYLFLQ